MNEAAEKHADVAKAGECNTSPEGGMPQDRGSQSKADAVLERLLHDHEAYFDVERDHSFGGRTFCGYAYFEESAERYVLSKRAKLWGAQVFEHVFFVHAHHLTEPELADWVSFMTNEGLSKVHLTPDHMTTYVTLVIVADSADEDALRLAKRARFRKSFALGLKGWCDLRLAVLDLASGEAVSNARGKELRKTLLRCAM